MTWITYVVDALGAEGWLDKPTGSFEDVDLEAACRLGADERMVIDTPTLKAIVRESLDHHDTDALYIFVKKKEASDAIASTGS